MAESNAGKRREHDGITIHEIPTDQLDPNPWNPNRMPEEMYAKLRAYIEREGFVEPLVVRRLESGRFQILGGEHRWRIAKELGYETVPTVVVEVDDRRAKILTVNLNELKGQSLPALMAELVHDLSREISLADLESQLPYDMEELEDFQGLLRIPDGLELQLQEEAERMERDRPRVLSFAVSPDQEATIEAALAEVGGSSRGAALATLAEAFLSSESGESA